MSGIHMGALKHRTTVVPFLTTPRTVTSMSGTAGVVIFKNDGTLTTDDGGGVVTVTGEWLTSSPTADTTNAALYEIRRTQVAGSLGVTFTGTMNSGTWYPLTSDRGVTVNAGGVVTRSNQSTWDIRLAGGPGTILATVDLTVVGTL